MVYMISQASDPARDAANPDQDHAKGATTNGATSGVPPPYFQQLVEQMQANNCLLQILCTQKEQRLQTALPAAIPAPATKRGGQRKKKPAKRPKKFGDNLAPASSRIPGQNRPEECSGNTSTRESLERRNSRYSRAEDNNTIQERASRTARSARGSSQPAAGPSGEKTELRAYLNPKRSANAARADSQVDKIWNRVFQDEERAIDLDRSPFTAEILIRPLPTKFKIPSLDSYDGSNDSVDHLDLFRTNLSLQGLEDSAMCRCFLLTLKGDARIWFHHLPSGTISSFRELTDLFLTQYASSRREEKQSWHLSHIKQKQGENPRRFLDHFVAEVRRIPRIKEEMKLGSYISALTYGPTPQQKRPTRQNVENRRISLGRSLGKGRGSTTSENTPARSNAGLGPENVETTDPPVSPL
ncbi:hypothetical protein Nepgr_028818 [Nepenthes gracilis]|uniref:Retrotransposon gag domain-containing protein n=1 Tax=Nepenthes gracilis TaxID=150966 RepID=A0AAD3TB32_NEPGR|nr:hypothetical protein Nepgr_028818 [Nepenthes gracilis]